MEVEKLIALASPLLFVCVFLLILNAVLPRFVGFTNHGFVDFAFSNWWILVLCVVAGFLLIVWIMRG